MRTRAIQRLRSFAGKDPGTWSLLAGTTVALATLVGGVAGVVAAGRTGEFATVPWLDLVLGSATVGLGYGVGAWYLAVERSRPASVGRVALALGAGGFLAGPLTWLLVGGWSAATGGGGRVQVAGVLEGSASMLSAPWLPAAGVGAVAAAGLVGVVTVHLRRRLGEATDGGRQ